ncbi:MAG: DUF4288 domain-containing protein [Gammaproteobacteria bacterium]
MIIKNDKNISPVGWYIGSYLIRFIELDEEGNDDLEKRFLSWENTVIVKAESMGEAFAKIETLAKENEEPYLGGPEGVPVQWVYEGITELLPIYEELTDGSEVMWGEHHPRKLKRLRSMAHRSVDFFKQ